MSRSLASALRRASSMLMVTLSTVSVACSGGGNSPAEPGPPEPPTMPVPPVEPGPGNEPGPPVFTNHIDGTYALRLVNDAGPGQTVTLADSAGNVIGLYRFLANTTLGVSVDQHWSLSLHYEDNGAARRLEDEGKFKRYGEDARDLVFESAIYGDQFYGVAIDGMAVIQYDFDGDGEAETVFGFDRILGPE